MVQTVADITVVEENREAVIAAFDEYLKQFPSKAEAAEALGISRVYVWKMRDGIKPISETVLEKLGFKLEVKKIKKYVPIKG